jgi:hypothetical protein
MLVLVASPALAFELDTKTLLKGKDHFSLLKTNLRYDELNLFLETCPLKPAKECVDAGKAIYNAAKYSSFQSYVVKTLVKRIADSKLELSALSFINPLLFKSAELETLVKKFPSEQIIPFLGSGYFLSDQPLNSLLISEPNLICRFSDQKEFTKKILSIISSEFNFYKKDFSSFPCGLELDESYSVLLSELKKSKQNNKFKHDYLFAFLRSDVSGDAYRSFPRYSKSSSANRSKLQWKKIKAYKPYIQTRIIRNLFYAGQYSMLADYAKLSKKQKPELEPDGLVYVVKSLAAAEKGDEVLEVSKDLKWQNEGWAEEVLLMRAAALLRKGEFKKARLELSELIKVAENLKLSGLYWTWVSYKKESLKGANKIEAVKTAETLLELYPFTYYGLMVANDLYGPKFFERYTKTNNIKQDFKSALTASDIERLEYNYTYEKRDGFKKAYFEIKSKLNPKQKSLMSLVFSNLDHQIEVIRALNKVWDEESGLRATPFVGSSFPIPYEKVSTEVSESLKWVSPSLIHAVIRQESAFNEEARSSANAMGLMQLLPSTAKEVARRSKNKSFKRRNDLYKPEVNIALGSNYMNRLINASEGYLPYAFASYNAGPGRMYRWSKERQDVKDLRKDFEGKSFDHLDDLWVEELPWTETRFYTKALLRNTGIYLGLMKNTEAMKCEPFWRCHRNSL